MERVNAMSKRDWVRVSFILVFFLTTTVAVSWFAVALPTKPEESQVASASQDTTPAILATSSTSLVLTEEDPIETPTPTATPEATMVPAISPQDYQAGIIVLIYGNDPYFEEKVDELLEHLAGLGINAVTLVTPFFQDSTTSNEVCTHPKWTLSDENIRIFFRKAWEKGFLRTFRLLMDESAFHNEGPGLWRGDLRPTDLNAWFASYGDLFERYAVIAEEEGVEVFVVGVELNSLEYENEEWTQLVNRLRGVYSGLLTYASNWDRTEDAPAEWLSHLDFVGVDAFFPLSVDDFASVEELRDEWRRVLDQVDDWRRAISSDAKVVLSEVGIGSGEGLFSNPFAWAGIQYTDGSFSLENGVFAVQGSGQDIWSSDIWSLEHETFIDEFHYVYQALSGDGSITARVLSQECVDCEEIWEWAKAGVIIKEEAFKGAPYALMAVTPEHGYSFEHGFTTNQPAGPFNTHIEGGSYTFPTWVRLNRVGDTITGLISSDGVVWREIGSVEIEMSSDVTVGLFVTAHSRIDLNRVQFDSVEVAVDSIVSAGPWSEEDWASEDIRRFDNSAGLESQRRFYAAVCQASSERSWVKGIAWWNVYLDSPEEPLYDEGFDPRGKPAEGEIAVCYKQIIPAALGQP